MKKALISRGFPTIILLFLNLILVVFLCFFYFTNVSLIGFFPDQIFPLLVGVFGLFTIKHFKSNKSGGALSGLNLLLPMSSILAGFAVLIPIICPLSFFFMSNFAKETRVRQYPSPSGRYVAETYFRYAGIVDADEVLTVRVRDHWLPFVEKDLYTQLEPTIRCVHSGNACIRWIDDQSILIEDTSNLVRRGDIHFDLPPFAVVLFIELCVVAELIN